MKVNRPFMGFQQACLFVAVAVLVSFSNADFVVGQFKLVPPSNQADQVVKEQDSADASTTTVSYARKLENGTSVTFTDPAPRVVNTKPTAEVYPLPIGYNVGPYIPAASRKPKQSNATPKGGHQWHPRSTPQEYVYDGNDRNGKVRVDSSWTVYGLDTEDTIGHFDTLEGQRIVTPSNRVALYAPRFGAVRRVDGVFKAQLNQPVAAFNEKTQIARAEGEDVSRMHKQNLAVDRYEGSERASGFVDRTRGVVSDNVTQLVGFRNGFKPYENLSLIKWGRVAKQESARLNLGLQSAVAWEDNLGLQVTVNKASPIIVKDVAGVNELIKVKSEDGTAILRVAKVASKIAAKAGEFVDFTIRFDNLSRKRIGNVTIIDNLTTRLEYVPGTAECSLKAQLITEKNEGDSLMLRWEITDPLPGGEGGVIRFRCRVR